MTKQIHGNVNNGPAIEAAFKNLSNSGTWVCSGHQCPEGYLAVYVQQTADATREIIGFVTYDFRETVTKIARKVWVCEPKAEGRQSRGDSWTDWVLFGPMITDEEAMEMTYARFGFANCGYNGGPGQTFARKPYVRRTATRVLVLQQGGLDI